MLRKTFRKNDLKINDNGYLSGVMKFIIAIIVIAVIGAAIIFATKLNSISIEGNNHYSSEELKDLLIKDKTDNNAILFYLSHNYGEQEAIPFIEKIDIKLTGRNAVKVQVYEKIVTGCIEYMESFMYFDREGIVVETSKERIDEVPIITGLQFSKLILHEGIEVDKPNIFHMILNLTQLIQMYDINVNVIHFTNDLEVVLYRENIRILLGKRDSYDEQLAQLPNLLSSLESKNGELAGNKSEKLVIDMKEFKEGQDSIIARPLN